MGLSLCGGVHLSLERPVQLPRAEWEHLKGWASSRKYKTEAAVKPLTFHIHLVPPWKSPAGPSHLHTPGGLEL